MTFTGANGISEEVFAFRYENVKHPDMLSFSKKDFVNAVAFRKLGVANTRKTVCGAHAKCTLVFLRCLPEDTLDKLLQGRYLH